MLGSMSMEIAMHEAGALDGDVHDPTVLGIGLGIAQFNGSITFEFRG